MLTCNITYNDNTSKRCDFSKIKKHEYKNIIKVDFHELLSYQIKEYASELFEFENLQILNTADLIRNEYIDKLEYPDEIANLIHLQKINVHHYSYIHPFHISKCYKNGNKAIIIHYQKDIILPEDIEYLNVFVGYTDDGINGDIDISDNIIFYLLNNLHIGLKYLQLNTLDFGVLKYIKNLPITLEYFIVNITDSMKECLYDRFEDYMKDANTELEKVKIPFNCYKEINYCARNYI